MYCLAEAVTSLNATAVLLVGVTGAAVSEGWGWLLVLLLLRRTVSLLLAHLDLCLHCFLFLFLQVRRPVPEAVAGEAIGLRGAKE